MLRRALQALRPSDEDEADNPHHGEDHHWSLHPFRQARAVLLGYSMEDLAGSWLMTAVGCWHAYLFWISACVFSTVGANELLRWWIRWYNTYRRLNFKGYLDFFNILAKSWIWMSVVSDLLRCCFILACDGLRADAFEAYRRVLLGEALTEMQEGGLYRGGWKQESARRKGLNWAIQLIIYGSLDVVPVVLMVIACLVEPAAESAVALTGKVAVPTACLHAVIFFVAWVATDAYTKVASLRRILKEKGSGGNPEEESADSESAPWQSDDASNSDGSLSEGSSAHKRPALQRRTAKSDMGVSEELSICIPICRGLKMLEALVPHLLWSGAVLAGLVRGNWALVAAGLFLGMLLSCFTCGLASRSATLAAMPWKQRETKRLLALQRWGEVYCGLSFGGQMAVRSTPAINLAVLANGFGMVSWWSYMVSCMVLLALMVAKQSLIYIERPMGWLIGIAEGALFHVGTALGCGLLQADRAFADCMLIFLLGFLRLWGMRRDLSDGLVVKSLAILWLCVVQFVIIAILVLAHQETEAQHFTAFCDQSLPGCKYTTFRAWDPKDSVLPQCSLRFSTQAEALTLADFGLFSSLAYEDQGTIARGLELYFPGWHIEERHFTASGAASESGAYEADTSGGQDWTTFYQFTEAQNRTSVFAVRGTQYLIDVLQDIDLWLPAFSIGMFEWVGPIMGAGFVDAVSQLTVTGRRESERRAFVLLLDKVRAQMRRHPERQFYITGHSLGGGIAKLVSAEVTHADPSMSLPAVVFAAPGLGVTSYVVYGERRSKEMVANCLTVMPENDLVSRVDRQVGVQVPVGCNGWALGCHSISRTLCSIYAACGSMRNNQNITLAYDCPKDG